MSVFKIEISTDNAAFQDDPGAEVARILREVAERVEAGELSRTVRDYNGNGVGSFWFEDVDQ